MTTGHLVTDGKLALAGDEHTHLLDHAGFAFVARFDTVQGTLTLKVRIGKLLFEGTDDVEDLVAHRARVDFDGVVTFGQLAQQGLGDLFVGADDDFTGLAIDHVERDLLVEKDVRQTLGELVGQSFLLGAIVILDLLDLLLVFGRGEFLLGRIRGGTAGALGHADIHDDAGAAGGNTQGGVLHVRGFFTEDGAQKALFRSQLGFALRRDLAHEDVAGLHFRADANHTILVKVFERFVAHVRDVPGNFFRPKLGVAGDDFEVFNVNRSVNVLLHHTAADDDGIFEVVAVPGHERDEHVLTQGQFALVGARTVGEHIALLDLLTALHEGNLIDAGAGVGAAKFAQRVHEDVLLRISLNAGPVFNELLVGDRQLAVLGGDDAGASRSSDDAIAISNDH